MTKAGALDIFGPTRVGVDDGETTLLRYPARFVGEVAVSDDANKRRTVVTLGVAGESRALLSSNHQAIEPDNFGGASVVLIDQSGEYRISSFPADPTTCRKVLINAGEWTMYVDHMHGNISTSSGAELELRPGASAIVVWDEVDEIYRVNSAPLEG